MKKITKMMIIPALVFALASCSGDKRKGIDYNEFKKTITLDADQEKQFDGITARYQKMQEENFEAAKAQGGNMDRVALGIKNEELRKRQAEEMAKVLKPEQMEKFNQFVDENSRKRPRYDNLLLEKIKTGAALDENQFAMLNAANDAFEKSFNDAHDIYHGNNDLAKEYWIKFDTQRKEAMKKALTPEQYSTYLEIVKDVQFKGRKK